METLSAAETIERLTDPGGFHPWPSGLRSTDPLDFVDSRPYPDRLAAARSATGSDESVLAGRAVVGGIPVALLVSEYGFVGGSIGAATGELITRAFDRAATEMLPVVAVTRSGGTRMQEGNYAFAQIAKTLAAVARLRRSGLPYIAYLAHPTMGGVLASWGSRAHVRFAEPGALIGFAGPRGTEALTGTRLPAHVQRAENLAAHGLVDEVVPLGELRGHLSRVLRVLGNNNDTTRGRQHTSAPGTGPAIPDPTESVLRSREPGRAGARELLAAVAREPTFLHGDGQGNPDDPAVLTALCTLDGTAAVVVAHDRSAGASGARPGPDGYRKARRGIALAAELGLPLVTIVDTPGAQLSRAAEQGGLSYQLADCLSELLDTPSPVLCVLLGEGGGGAALALLAGDAVLASRDAWLAPIAPEAASAIVHGSPTHARAVARQQRIDAYALQQLGLVDELVAAGTEPMASALADRLHALVTEPAPARRQRRQHRYRQIGNGSLQETGTFEEEPDGS